MDKEKQRRLNCGVVYHFIFPPLPFATLNTNAPGTSVAKYDRAQPKEVYPFSLSCSGGIFGRTNVFMMAKIVF